MNIFHAPISVAIILGELGREWERKILDLKLN
jgi:hypothetical protein